MKRDQAAPRLPSTFHLPPSTFHLLLFTLSLLAALPLWGPGLVNTRGGGDSPFLLWRVHQLTANLRDGVFPARWMPDAAYGLGYPFFSYYAALPYYLASAFNLAGLDILAAIKLTQTLGFILAAAASYSWFTRVYKSQAAAWLGAVAYTFAPFHLVNVYVRGDSLSEFYAFVFYPLILGAIDAVVEQRAASNVIALGLAFGGLVVTHTLSAAIFTPFVLLYALAKILTVRQPPLATFHLPLATLYLPLAGLTLGLLLSAWYWLPALLEMRYIQTSTLTQGYFYYANHFRSLDLIQPSLGFVYDAASEQTTPFAMGLVQALVTGIGLAFILKSLSHLKSQISTPASLSTFHFLLSTFYFLLSTFMLTPLSRPLWDHLPILPMVQFPWRFLSVQALFAAMLTAFVVERLARWRVAAAAVMAGALSLSVMLPLHPDQLMIDAGDVTTQRLQLYELFTANIGTTITYEWLPRDVNPRPYTSELVTAPGASPRAFAVEGELASASELEHRATARVWQIDAATDAALVFPLHYWPGWQAAIDGAPAPVRPAHNSGRVTLDVPRGQHIIELKLSRTPLRLAAEVISLLALIACLAYYVSRFAFRISRFTPSGHVSRLAPLVFVLAALSLLLVIGRPPVNDETETMDFIQMPYLHRGAVDFGNAILERYELSAERVTTGQSVNLATHWRVTAGPVTATLALVSLSEHLPDLHAPIALDQAIIALDSGQRIISCTLSVPSDVASGGYLVQVRVYGRDGELAARTSSGAKRGWIYLRPIYVQNDQTIANEPALATFGGHIRLHAVYAEQQTPTQLLVKLDWSVAKAVSANYSIALRLYNAQGDWLTSLDTQPGHGFLPTTAWQPGEKITDRLILPLPEGLPPRDDYELEVILYDLANNLAEIGRRRQPGIALTQYARRSLDSPALAQFGSCLALAALDLPATHPQGAPELTFDAGWLATENPPADVWVHWWLVEQNTKMIVAKQAHIRLETAAWPPGAFVRETVHMPLTAKLTPGRYYLGVALSDARGGIPIGQPAWLEQMTIEVTGRPRSFAAPPLDEQMNVNLGGLIAFEGYSLRQEQDALQLMLAWRAQQTMTQDYTVFVHLLNAEDAIVTQHDAMPVDNAFPTSWWAAGEVVTETITLSLQNLPPGDYRLAVGMYAGETRLEARGTDGQRLPADRIVLPANIRLDWK